MIPSANKKHPPNKKRPPPPISILEKTPSGVVFYWGGGGGRVFFVIRGGDYMHAYPGALALSPERPLGRCRLEALRLTSYIPFKFVCVCFRSRAGRPPLPCANVSGSLVSRTLDQESPGSGTQSLTQQCASTLGGVSVSAACEQNPGTCISLSFAI